MAGVARRRRRIALGVNNWGFRSSTGLLWPMDMDFVNNRALLNGVFAPATSRLTTSRLNSKFAESGDTNTPYVLFANNIPAQTSLGLDIEASRTNIIPNNTSFLPGGAGSNTCVVSTDIPPLFTGVPVWKHTLNQPGGDNNCGFTQIATAWALNTTYVLSMYVYVTAQQAANINTVTIRQDQSGTPWDGAQTTIVGYNPALTDRWQRIYKVQTTSAAGVSNPVGPGIGPGVNDATAGHFLYSTGWQFEDTNANQAIFPSSLIATSGAPITKQSDIITVNALPTFSSTAGTVYAEFVIRYDSSVGVFPGAFSLDDGTGTNKFSVYLRSVDDTVHGSFNTAGASGNQDLLVPGAYTYGTIVRVAIAWANNDIVTVVNGGTPVTGATYTPCTPTTLRLGLLAPTNNFLFGKLRRIAYVGTRQPNALLQAITDSTP